jgi:C-terminal processing protease CtpA/Prc
MTPSTVRHTKDDLPDAQRLADFRRAAAIEDARLTVAQMQQIARLARALLDDYYVHLPFKRAMHAIDPIRSLRLLEERAKELDARSFHDEMLAVFADLRDRHTVYWVPAPYRNRSAALPFRLQRVTSGGRRKYVVSEVTPPWLPRQPRDRPRFGPGVEVTHWNAVPVERAIALHARWDAGANPDARLARGIAHLTDRPLTFLPLPDEDWVEVRFAADRRIGTIRLEWRVFELGAVRRVRERTEVEEASAYELGVDPVAEAVRRSQKLRLRPEYVKLEAQVTEGLSPEDPNDPRKPVSRLPDNLQYSLQERGDERYGYLRIRSFDVPSAAALVEEVMDILDKLDARDGLIIDVRGNGGGKIEAGERLLQLFTPHVIQPEGVQFLSTPGTRRIVESATFAQWEPSLSLTEQTGEAFSDALPLRKRYGASCNEIGQRYHGPVVLIVDALCYSTTDVFAAGFQDNDVGCKIIGTDRCTGAGGGNPWSVDAIEYQANEDWERPEGVSFDIAVRRSLRVGDRAGVPLEGIGVTPDDVYELTERDVLGENEDLIDAAIARLRELPSYALESTVEWSAGVARIKVRSKGIAQLDVYLDGRPAGRPVAVDGDETVIEVSAAPDRSHYYRLYGFDERNELVASRRDRFGSGLGVPGRVQMSPVLIGDPPDDPYE